MTPTSSPVWWPVKGPGVAVKPQMLSSCSHPSPTQPVVIAIHRRRRSGGCRPDRRDRIRSKGWLRPLIRGGPGLSRSHSSVPTLLQTHVVLSSSRRILVLWLGGTIGSSASLSGSVQLAASSEQLADLYAGVLSDFAVDLEMLEPEDGIDLGPRDWSSLLNSLQHRLSRYDGFVVATGTDTLAYVASAMAFGFGLGLTKPVAFTGARVPPNHLWSDAKPNLYRACLVAQSDCAEVVVVYGDQIFRAVRCDKRDDRGLQPFWSPTYPALGTVVGNVELSPGVSRRRNAAAEQPSEAVNFADGLAVVSATPAASQVHYDRILSGDVRALIIPTTGAGSVPRSLLPLVDAAAREVPVVVTISYPADPDNYWRYGPPLRAREAGAVFTPPMTLPAAVTKLSWALGRGFDRQLVERLMTDGDIVGEIDVEQAPRSPP